jgi:hypothetical protein
MEIIKNVEGLKLRSYADSCMQLILTIENTLIIIKFQKSIIYLHTVYMRST